MGPLAARGLLLWKLITTAATLPSILSGISGDSFGILTTRLVLVSRFARAKIIGTRAGARANTVANLDPRKSGCFRISKLGVKTLCWSRSDRLSLITPFFMAAEWRHCQTGSNEKSQSSPHLVTDYVQWLVNRSTPNAPHSEIRVNEL